MDNEIDDRGYYVRRMFASMRAAQRANNAAVRLIHLDLAGRYSVAATHSQIGVPPEPCGNAEVTGSSFATYVDDGCEGARAGAPRHS